MAQQGRVALKEFFKTDDVPTAAQFADFIDSGLNLADDNYVQTANDYTNLAVAEVAKIANKADSATTYTKLEVDSKIDTSLYAFATLTTAQSQTINTSINNNAACSVQLLGDAILTLSNITAPCTGVVNIAAQTVDRNISIVASGITVQTATDLEMITSALGKTSFSWVYDGVDILINKGNYVAVV